MPWKISVSKTAERQLRQLDRPARDRIIAYLQDRVAPLKDPRELGGSLEGDLEGSWRYRVGDYRIVCRIHFEEIIVEVTRVGHRREVYR